MSNTTNRCLPDTLISINSNIIPSVSINEFTQKISDGEKSKWNYLWVYPINLAASLIGLALAPIAAIIDLIVGTVFFLLSGCTTERANTSIEYMAFIVAGAAQLTVIPAVLFARIVYPPAFGPNINNCLRINF